MKHRKLTALEKKMIEQLVFFLYEEVYKPLCYIIYHYSLLKTIAWLVKKR